LLAHAEYTTNPGGPTQRASQRQADSQEAAVEGSMCAGRFINKVLEG
jgi:hypothetical protein